jgi:hypothetical protein
MKYTQAENELEKIKIICRLDQKQVLDLSRIHGIQLE